MKDMEVNRLLTELRSLSARSSFKPQQLDKAEGSQFAQTMVEAARNVSEAQMSARKAATDFEMGRGDLATAMMLGQTASVSFKAMTEVRNKLVQAYQEVMSMPL
tara:strand:+ start:442 stop:753 length:312 start_codon:yes stop_codon:yes gene_type:complete